MNRYQPTEKEAEEFKEKLYNLYVNSVNVFIVLTLGGIKLGK